MANQMFRRAFLSVLGAGAGAAITHADQPRSGGASVYDVRDFGARGDGARLETAALQAAIDRCAGAGGGTVLFRAGAYRSGSLLLRSNVVLHLDAGAVLRGSRRLEDYAVRIPRFRSYTDNYTERSLLYAEGAENIGIEGHGVIDGEGASFHGSYKLRPFLMRFVECRRVTVSDICIRDSPMWVQHYLACEDVLLRGLRVRSRVNDNNDGIDIDCCRRVRISDCDIWSGDDAIVLKSTADRATTDVTIANCVLSSLCNALKLGTETNGCFENIAISNCTIYDTRLAGLTLQIVDGGVLDRVTVSNLTMRKVGAPIFIRLGDRGRPFLEGGPHPPVGRLKNVTISNIEAVDADPAGCAIAGLPDHPIENLTLENIRLSFEGGGIASAGGLPVAEKAGGYPEYNMFGRLPAYGFFCRHVRSLRLSGIETSFARADERPALVFDDVDGLQLAGAALATLPEGGPAVHLANVTDAIITACRLPNPVRRFLRVSGPRSGRINLLANDFSRAAKAIERDADVSPEAIFLSSNAGAP
jgi:polygalacturonase